MVDDEIKKYNFRRMIKLVLEGKQYIYKEKQVAWTNYIVNNIKTGKRHGMELEETVSIMQLLDSGQYEVDQIIYLLKHGDYPAETLCHVISNLLYFYKDGPAIFKGFYKDCMTPQLYEILTTVEKKNEEMEFNKNKIKGKTK